MASVYRTTELYQKFAFPIYL